MNKEEVGIEISFTRKYNLGNFSSKDYSIKLSGTEENIKKQFEEKKEVLINYLKGLESIVDIANDINQFKNKVKEV